MGTPTIRMPEIRVCDDDQLVGTAAEQIASDMASIIARRGGCRLGLAGGGTPRPIYEKLASEPLAGRVDWDRVHFFWGDERCVPPDHEKSNYRMVKEALLDHVEVTEENVHRIEGERAPADAAKVYLGALGTTPIDILLLGMGGDGHTASLFSDTANLGNETRRVVATTSPVEPTDRVSLTVRAINEARMIYFLVAGEGKASRLAEVYEQIISVTPVLPAAHVLPTGGRVVWLVDSAAATQLPQALPMFQPPDLP